MNPFAPRNLPRTILLAPLRADGAQASKVISPSCGFLSGMCVRVLLLFKPLVDHAAMTRSLSRVHSQGTRQIDCMRNGDHVPQHC